MSLKNFRLESKLVPNYRVKKDNYYLLYMLDNNLMFKKYLLNDEYYKMLVSRKSDYLEYLRSLMNNDSELIVKPVDIYAKHSLVTSYTYQKESGTSIRDMYPKTRLDSFMEAIKEFYSNLDELANFDLRVLKPEDILYTGKIKVSGLDESEYEENNQTQSIVNDLLFRGIFNIDNNGEVIINDENIAKLYSDLKLEQIDILKFMDEYIRFVRSEYGNCKYVKHLKRRVITSKKNTK